MMNNTKIVAIVPMKGHSERVKDKNIRDFYGKPLLYYILQSLDCAECISKIYIDTDSKIIADTAKTLFPSIDIIWRPKELQGDYVSMNSVLSNDIEVVKESVYLQTHVTNPLLSPETIDKACSQYIEKMEEYDTLFSVNKLQTRFYDKDAKPINHNPENLIRTQDLEPYYEENSNIYIFSRKSFATSNARIGIKPQMFVMDPIEAIDIDVESDFELAEYIYKMRRGI